MAFWEFLIQKEGDRSWLPLESPDVEILEGRYRVVARSNRVNVPVEIRITHDAIDEDPPKRRVQKRTSRTNRDGLIVVIPYTRLHSGIWELACNGDLMADMLGEGWHHAVKLQVMSHESGLTEAWDPDWQDEVQIHPVTVSTDPHRAESHSQVVGFEPADAIPADATSAESSQPEQPLPAIAHNHLDPSVSDAISSPSTDEAASTVPAVAFVETDAAQTGVVEPEAVEPETAETEPENAEPLTPIAIASLLENARQASQQILDDLFQELDDDSIERSPVLSTPAIKSDVEASPPIPLQIMLRRETYTAQRGQRIDLIGQIHLLEEAPDQAIAPFAAELWLCLRSPQTGQALLDVRRSLNIESLPHAFELSITVPETDQTHLFLGELCLLVSQEPGETPQVWVNQSFTITVDLNELLEAIANEPMDSDDLHPPLEFAKPVDTDLNLAFLNLLGAPKPMLNLQTAGKQLLPPQLYQPDPAQSRAKGIDLPFSNSTASSTMSDLGKQMLSQMTSSNAANPPASEPSESSESSEPESGEPSEPLTVDTSTAGDEAVPLPPESDVLELQSPDLEDIPVATRAIADPNLTDAMIAEPMMADSTIADPELANPNSYPAVPSAPNPVRAFQQPPSSSAASTQHLADAPLEFDALPHPPSLNAPPFPAKFSRPAWQPSSNDGNDAFRSLNLKQRFWSRLSSMASDAELADWLGRVDPVESGISRDAPLGLDSRLSTDEFVIDDEPVISTAPVSQPDAEDAVRLNRFSEAEHFPILADDEPVPLPDMELPAGELVSGKSIRVKVKLPNLEPRIYVKLWLRDRQTRALLDGPKWLVNFIPNAAGDLEAWTHLMIPFGCLEIQFEAIAIEMATQRESDKTTSDRIVIPPDLPISSLDLRDELDV